MHQARGTAPVTNDALVLLRVLADYPEIVPDAKERTK